MLCVFNGYMCSGYRSSDFHKFDAKCSSLQVDYLSGRFPLRSLRNIMRVCLATCAVKIRYWPRHARYLRVTLVKSYVTRETLMRETCVSRAYSSQTTCKIDCKGINYFRKMRVPSKLPANCTVDVPLCLMLPLVPYIVFANIKGSGCAGSHEPSVFAMWLVPLSYGPAQI